MEDITHSSVYYAHPYHSWERGTNENTNGLIREYFPKKTDFTLVSDEEIAKVEYILNTRPRKRLGWSTPLQVMSVALQC
jgi:IS30 family transposase